MHINTYHSQTASLNPYLEDLNLKGPMMQEH